MRAEKRFSGTTALGCMGWTRVHHGSSNGDVKVGIPRLGLGMTTMADVIPNKVRDLDLRELAKHEEVIVAYRTVEGAAAHRKIREKQISCLRNYSLVSGDR